MPKLYGSSHINHNNLAGLQLIDHGVIWGHINESSSPHLTALSLGAFPPYQDLTSYNLYAQNFKNETLDQSMFYWYDSIYSDGDAWQSFTAGNSDYLTSFAFIFEVYPSFLATVSILAGEGISGAVLYTKSNVSVEGFEWTVVDLESPVKLTMGNKYTMRIQSSNQLVVVDYSGYAGGVYKGNPAIAMDFATYTSTLEQTFSVNKSTSVTKMINVTATGLALSNGIIQTNASGVLSSSVTLPNGTLGTTQPLGDDSTKLATTAFVQDAVAVENLWNRTGNDLHPETSGNNINVLSGAIGNVVDMDGYNIKLESSGEVLAISQYDSNASENCWGAGWQSFTAVNNNFLTKFTIKMIPGSYPNQTISIKEGDGVSGTVLWTAGIVTLSHGWNTFTVSPGVPLTTGKVYSITIEGHEYCYGWTWYPNGSYAGGGWRGSTSDLAFEIFTTAFSANFCVKKDSKVGIGTITPSTALDVIGVNTSYNFISSVATGTQPYACTSTTKCTNLNADTADGYHFDQNVLQASVPTFRSLEIGGGAWDNYILLDAAANKEASITFSSGGSDNWKLYRPASTNNLVLYDTVNSLNATYFSIDASSPANFSINCGNSTYASSSFNLSSAHGVGKQVALGFATGGTWRWKFATVPNTSDYIFAEMVSGITETARIYLKAGGGNGYVGIGSGRDPSSHLHVRSSETGATWAGRIACGGSIVAVVAGEFDGKAWFGAHNAALNAWDNLYICPSGKPFMPTVYNNNLGGGMRTIVMNSSGELGVNTSLRSLKENINPNFDTSWFYNLIWNEFTYKGSNEKYWGLIFDETVLAQPELCTYDKDGNALGVEYLKLWGAMGKCIQEQKIIINSLISRIETLENK